METLIFSLSFALLILSGVETTTFTFQNNCPYIVWPGTLTGSGKPQLSSTGFELTFGGSSSLDTQAPWSGRFWGRTRCSTDSAGKFSCGTADCASGQVACNGAGAVPPATLIELTLEENSGQDNYDVSLVDGFNLPMSISPTGGTGDCRALSCPKDVNDVCPTELAVKGSNGGVIACKSACAALNKPEYCCTDNHNTTETCPPTNYSRIFKTQCPQAYSYAYDDKSSLVTCNGGPNYRITFCPRQT